MTVEGQELDVKSIRYAMDKHKDLEGLAGDCVAFASADQPTCVSTRLPRDTRQEPSANAVRLMKA